MSRKPDIEFIREDFERNNCILTSTEYKNSQTKLDFFCSNGHYHSITWAKWQQGQRCPYCAGNAKLTIEFIREEFKKEGYILKTILYKGNRQKLEYICSKGHHHSISWHDWQVGHRCPMCARGLLVEKLRKDFNVIKKSFEADSYILKTIVYENARQKLSCVCPNGHTWLVSWNSWQQGVRCPICVLKLKEYWEMIRKDFNVIKKSFEDDNYTLVTIDYENAHQKLECICPNGHRYSVSWNKWQLGRRCPFCSNRVSRWEKKVKKFVVCLGVSYVPNNKTQLINPTTNRPLELDIWFPQLNKAIECNGVYWHNRDGVVKNDKIKRQLCQQQGIDLLVLTDKEWKEDIEKCKNKIKTFVCGVN